MLVENKYVYRCNGISEVDGFLSVRDVLKLEMFGDEDNEGFRNFEVVIDELKRIYPKLWVPEYKDKIDTLSTSEKDRYDFVDSILNSLVGDCGVGQDFFNYAIWACDTPEDVGESYNIEGCEVSKYFLKKAILLQDLGPEGSLYGVPEYPEEIYEETKNMKDIFKRIYESTNDDIINDQEVPNTEQTVPNTQEQLPNKEVETGYYHFANGEDEVRELVQSIRNGNDTEDKQFLELVDRDLNDWIISPVAVEIMKMSMMENEDDIVKCYDKIDSLFSETVIYKKVNEPDEKAVITEWNQIWDDIGDGKNPLDYYIVSQDRSDGLMRTYIYVNNGYSWYYVASLDLDEVKDAFMDYCYETGDYSMIPKILGYLHNGSDIFSNGTSIV